MIQTSPAKNVNIGIRGDSFVVGHIPLEEITDPENPFSFLVSGVGWLVRNGKSYIDESLELDKEDISHQESTFITSSIARTVLGYDSHGRLLLLHVNGNSDSETLQESNIKGLGLQELAAWAVELGFINAVNLVGGDQANLVEHNALISLPSGACDNVSKYSPFRCESQTR